MADQRIQCLDHIDQLQLMKLSAQSWPRRRHCGGASPDAVEQRGFAVAQVACARDQQPRHRQVVELKYLLHQALAEKLTSLVIYGPRKRGTASARERAVT